MRRIPIDYLIDYVGGWSGSEILGKIGSSDTIITHHIQTKRYFTCPNGDGAQRRPLFLSHSFNFFIFKNKVRAEDF